VYKKVASLSAFREIDPKIGKFSDNRNVWKRLREELA